MAKNLIRKWMVATNFFRLEPRKVLQNALEDFVIN